MKTTDQNPEWNRARVLLADLKSAVRRSVCVQILLGKELRYLKTKLGFEGAGRRLTIPARAGIVRDWPRWCRAELDISDDTADRYIACFEYALSHSKDARIKRLLKTPTVELDGSELEILAAHVSGLVKIDDGAQQPLTQVQILRELGIIKDTRLKGGETPKPPPLDEASRLKAMANVIFTGVRDEFDAVGARIADAKISDGDFLKMMAALTLNPEKPGETSLLVIERQLEEIPIDELAAGLKSLIERVKLAIAAEMARATGETEEAVARERKKRGATSLPVASKGKRRKTLSPSGVK